MNITFNNLLKSSINYYLNYQHKPYKKEELNYVCKFSELGFKFGDKNSLGLTNFEIRDKVIFTLNSNKQLIDKQIKDIIFNKEVIIDKNDLSMFKMIVFALLIKLSRKNDFVIIGDELYVY